MNSIISYVWCQDLAVFGGGNCFGFSVAKIQGMRYTEIDFTRGMSDELFSSRIKKSSR